MRLMILLACLRGDVLRVLRKLDFVVDPQRPRRADGEANVGERKVDQSGRVQYLELVAVDRYGRPSIAGDRGGGELGYHVPVRGCCGCLLELLAGADGHGGAAGVCHRHAIVVEEEERRKQQRYG